MRVYASSPRLQKKQPHQRPPPPSTAPRRRALVWLPFSAPCLIVVRVPGATSLLYFLLFIHLYSISPLPVGSTILESFGARATACLAIRYPPLPRALSTALSWVSTLRPCPCCSYGSPSAVTGWRPLRTTWQPSSSLPIRTFSSESCLV